MSTHTQAVASKSPTSTASPELLTKLLTILPGIVLAAIISGAAYALRGLPGLGIFSPMILAVIIGVIFANIIELPAKTAAGIAFCQRPVLRAAIVLLGFQLTFTQVQAIGLSGIAIVAVSLLATFVATLGVARLLGVDSKLAELIAAGTSICGASAIVATNSVTNANDEDVAYAVASITLFGTLAMFIYPLLMPVFGLSAPEYGLWAGTAIHEVAQVIGAGFQNGPEAGEISTIAKLSRVAMLAPLVLGLGYLSRLRQAKDVTARAPVPWFVFGFAAVVLFNSFVTLPEEFRTFVPKLTTFMLTMGLAAMGLRTNVGEIRSKGLRPLLLAFTASIFIAGLSLLLIKLF